MDEKEMEITLSAVDDTVSDAPPEPEAPESGESVLEEYSYGVPVEKEEKTEPEVVSQENVSTNDGHEEHRPEEPSAESVSYRKEDSEGAISAKQPPSLNFVPGSALTRIKGTGLVVWAVQGSPVL